MMADFMVNTDMFGMYVRIPTGYSREMHIYKVVSKYKTNSYCDVPIVHGSKPVPHEKEFHDLSDLEDVLNVIHCGIDETEVIRVALKDCEIVTPTADVAPKSEVAREIFTEIEKLIFVGGFTGEVSNLTILTTKDYEALKKKYGVTDTNVGNKYFTAEQVRAMPPEEVRKNYSAIMESMKKWGEQK